MLCDRCKKNEASVQLESIINGEKTSHRLCMSCAAELEMNVDISKLLSSLLSGAFPSNAVDEIDDRVCKNCGMSYQEFKTKGRFGCSSCYESFEPQTGSMLKNIHGSTAHTGKIPNKNRAEHIYLRDMKTLRTKLSAAVMNEEFEEAARIRDEIKSLTPAKECEVDAHDKMV